MFLVLLYLFMAIYSYVLCMQACRYIATYIHVAVYMHACMYMCMHNIILCT